MFGVEKVRRVSGEEVCRDEAFVGVKHGAGPLPDATIGALASACVQASCCSMQTQNQGISDGHNKSRSEVNEKGNVRHRMPVPESHIGAAFMPNIVSVQEEAELGLRGQSPALGARVHREVVVRGEDWPGRRDAFERDEAVEGTDHEFTISTIDTITTSVLDPALRHRHLPFARAPERRELGVGDGAPLGAEGGDVHRARGALVVPPEGAPGDGEHALPSRVAR